MDRCPLCLYQFSEGRPKDEGRPICVQCSNRFDALTEKDKAEIGSRILLAEAQTRIADRLDDILGEAGKRVETREWFDRFPRDGKN